MTTPSASTTPTPPPDTSGPASASSRARLWLALWLLAALAVSLSGVITLERRFLVPLTLGGLVLAQLALYWRGGSVRAFADSVDVRVILLFQAVRAPIGAAFLVLIDAGLDPAFAYVAGVGDVVSGLGALLVLALAPRSRAALLVWNLVALADILAVVFTAQRILIFSDHPQTLWVIGQFPGTLLPTFLVPLVISTHLLVLARLRRAAR